MADPEGPAAAGRAPRKSPTTGACPPRDGGHRAPQTVAIMLFSRPTRQEPKLDLSHGARVMAHEQAHAGAGVGFCARTDRRRWHRDVAHDHFAARTEPRVVNGAPPERPAAFALASCRTLQRGSCISPARRRAVSLLPQTAGVDSSLLAFAQKESSPSTALGERCGTSFFFNAGCLDVSSSSAAPSRRAIFFRADPRCAASAPRSGRAGAREVRGIYPLQFRPQHGYRAGSRVTGRCAVRTERGACPPRSRSRREHSRRLTRGPRLAGGLSFSARPL
jgi:hypothetical protein